MALIPSVTKLVIFVYVIFTTIFCIALVAVSASSFQFQVGGERGWIKPSGNETQTHYDKWATNNRFHVGDTLYFRYRNDSVLAVNYTDYKNCIVLNPISKFSDGNTVLRIDRYGFYYFISGQPGHCKGGQKLVIRVMVQSSEVAKTPRTAPSPKANTGDSGDYDGWGPPSLMNSTIKRSNSTASRFLSFLGGVLVILSSFIVL
ncbi:hypothetical protein I3843_12G137600 [Carya illinoinensis]|uniref:Phytocyanin domain-containing protein n=1 Tax=Carya illinoinensis TaxID=32201 RepID=A0A8T1P1E3_CARIL|nr:stellacyanin-like [Carya illinoinensis]KAG6634747.1 hypothetical protein CIPAW_12G138500 [Carya illinoinensis]KAG7953983.1 hypothetical protein I3843_12G137600 [Carya illinoinensis]